MRVLLILTLIVVGPLAGWSADWLTDGSDTKRTAWQRDETIFNKANVGESKLLWKIQLDNKPREMHSFLAPLIVEGVQTAEGPKEIAVIAGVSDNLYAIDVETGS